MCLFIALRYITALGYIPVLVLTFASVISSGSGETVSTNECCEVKLTEYRKFGRLRFCSAQWFVTNLTVVPFLDQPSSSFSNRMGKVPGILGVICQAFILGQWNQPGLMIVHLYLIL